MTKKSLVVALFCVAALALPAVAASHSGRLMHTKPTGKVTRAVQPPSTYTIYSNLTNDPNNLYNCCNGYLIAGIDSEFGESIANAVTFTPKANAKIIHVEIGASWEGAGANQVNISVYSDGGGVPGTLLATGTASNLPNFGSCCALASIHLTPHLAVTAGTPYWIVADTPTSGTGDDFAGVWNLANAPTVAENVDSSGWFTFNTGNGFAVAVLGAKSK